MFKKRVITKTFKRFVSLLLVLTVTAGLFVTYDFSAFAEVEAATGNDIYAILYRITANGYELVFQRGNDPDPNKEFVKEYSEFADNFISKDLDSWQTDWNIKINNSEYSEISKKN